MVVWHPGIDAGMVRAATRARAVAIAAEEEWEAWERWENARGDVLAVLGSESGVPLAR
jgi:hypothetical protein